MSDGVLWLCAAAKRLDLITGRGLHSEGNVARLLPAVLEYLDRQRLHYEVNYRGGGVVVDIPDADDDEIVPGPGQDEGLHSFHEA